MLSSSVNYNWDKGCDGAALQFTSSVNYNWDKGCDGAALQFTVLSYYRLRHSSSKE
jgi:hypothetical protein